MATAKKTTTAAPSRIKKKREFNIKTYVIGALRRASYRTPMRYQALNAAKQARNEYVCKKCKKVFGRKEIQVDHIKPIVDPKKGFEGFDPYVERMFCTAEGLQVLCKPCHKVKSKKENERRKKYAKKTESP